MTSNRLPVLAGEANAAHDKAADALRSAAQAARDAGTALIEAKGIVGHGGWADWLASNFKGGSRTAQRYMRVAKNWDDISAKTTCVSDLSVNEALRLLEGRDELERALVLQAEEKALGQEADFLRSAVETADKNGLNVIIARCRELHDRAVEIRGTAIREVQRLSVELARATRIGIYKGDAVLDLLVAKPAPSATGYVDVVHLHLPVEGKAMMNSLARPVRVEALDAVVLTMMPDQEPDEVRWFDETPGYLDDLLAALKQSEKATA